MIKTFTLAAATVLCLATAAVAAPVVSLDGVSQPVAVKMMMTKKRCMMKRYMGMRSCRMMMMKKKPMMMKKKMMMKKGM